MPNNSPMPKRCLGSRLRVRLLLGLLIILTALLSFRSIDDLDYGIHIGTGLWILNNNKVPTTDPFTWSIPDHIYVAYHWGFQVIAAALYQWFDHFGPVMMRMILVLTTALVLVVALVRRRVEPIVAGACGLMGIFASEIRFAVRPELFSYLFLAALIAALDSWRGGSRRALWFVPLIFVGWINTHIYILGFVVLGAYLCEELLQRRCDRSFLIAIFLSIGALFLNPYGIDAILEPVRLFTRMSKDNLFAQNISELASPLSIDEDPRLGWNFTIQFCSWLGLMMLALPSLVALYRKRYVADVIILCAFGALSLVAVRNLSLFVIVAVPIVARGLTLIIDIRRRLWVKVRRPIFYTLVIIGFVTSLRVYNGAWYAMQRRDLHTDARLERATLAFGAAEFVERTDLKGRGFNNFNVGGTLILGAPSHQIFIDGRNEVTGEAFFRRYLELSDPQKLDTFFSTAQVEYAVLGHANMMHIVRHLLASNQWTIVYYDAVAVVLVRNAGPNGVVPPAMLPAPISGEEERWHYLKKIEIRPSLIDGLARWLFGGEELPSERDRIGTFLLRAGMWREAERLLLEAAVMAPNFWETSNNLGALYLRLKEWEICSFVYRNVLMLNRSDRLAQERQEMSWFYFKKEALEKQT